MTLSIILVFALYGHYNAKLDRGVHVTVVNRDMYFHVEHLHFLFIAMVTYVLKSPLRTSSHPLKTH